MAEEFTFAEIDIHVGSRLKARRKQSGCTLEKLAQAAGVTFQQIQKYEKGSNRISASRLYRMAYVLNVPVAYFFEDLNGPVGETIKCISDMSVDDGEAQRLMSAYGKIENPELRLDVLRFIKALSTSERGS